MKKIIALLLTVVVCLSFGGCGLNIASVENLMHPPKLSGDSSLLQEAFENYTDNATVVMKTPMSGDNRSSYLFYDLDNDGESEGFVFYSNPVVDSFAYISVFKKLNGEWSCISNIKGKGEEIYDVQFADINGDAIMELAVSWNSLSSIELASYDDFGSSQSRTMTIYSYNGSALTLIKTESFNTVFIDDLNGDNSDELFIINTALSNQTKTTVGKIISFSNDYEVTNKREFTMTGILEVLNIVTDNYTVNEENHTRLYIDGLISENGVITEVVDISHSDFLVKLPLYDSNVSNSSLTLRDVRTTCTDIDNDGVVEIPTLETLEYGVRISSESDSAMPFSLTVWSELNLNETVTDFKCLLNSTYGYMVIFPQDSVGKITATYNVDTNVLTYQSLDENGTVGSELFSIRAFSKLNWEENDYNYVKIDEKGAYVYGYLLFDKDNADILTDYINKNFVLIG